MCHLTLWNIEPDSRLQVAGRGKKFGSYRKKRSLVHREIKENFPTASYPTPELLACFCFVVSEELTKRETSRLSLLQPMWA